MDNNDSIQVGEFSYHNLSKNKISIDKYFGSSAKVNVPIKILGQEVVEVGELAFAKNTIIENANEKNLITGTRYLNIEGMLPFKNEVVSYVKETRNHVMYRVNPIFEGSNLVAGGVLMETYTVENSGLGICFCVYAYNVQPGIVIDYATGESWRK